MRKLLAVLAVAVLVLSSGAALAGHITQPQLPEEGFYDYSYSAWECGELLILYYNLDEVKWSVHILSGADHPLAVARKKDDSVTVWIDRDRDGHFDEMYADSAKSMVKYPTPCDAVK